MYDRQILGDIVDVIECFCDDNGRPPTFSEIRYHMRMRPMNLLRYLGKLEEGSVTRISTQIGTLYYVLDHGKTQN